MSTVTVTTFQEPSITLTEPAEEPAIIFTAPVEILHTVYNMFSSGKAAILFCGGAVIGGCITANCTQAVAGGVIAVVVALVYSIAKRVFFQYSDWSSSIYRGLRDGCIAGLTSGFSGHVLNVILGMPISPQVSVLAGLFATYYISHAR